VAFLCAFGLAKHLKEGRFLEHGHAEHLQDCVETGLDIEALLDDCDEHVDRDGDPDLDLDGVLGGADPCSSAGPYPRRRGIMTDFEFKSTTQEKPENLYLIVG
jgi:hypothetical protein